eukprot:scaffold236715_cov14-Prasinocladus_malaysianus.AAC.1
MIEGSQDVRRCLAFFFTLPDMIGPPEAKCTPGHPSVQLVSKQPLRANNDSFVSCMQSLGSDTMDVHSAIITPCISKFREEFRGIRAMG